MDEIDRVKRVEGLDAALVEPAPPGRTPGARTQLVALILGGLLIAAFVVLQSFLVYHAIYGDRNTSALARKIATSSLKGCYRVSNSSIATADSLRADAVANEIVASDPKQPAQTQHARSREVGYETKAIEVLDHQIESTYWPYLVNPVDRATVRQSHYSCIQLFPQR